MNNRLKYAVLILTSIVITGCATTSSRDRVVQREVLIPEFNISVLDSCPKPTKVTEDFKSGLSSISEKELVSKYISLKIDSKACYDTVQNFKNYLSEVEKLRLSTNKE